MKKRIWAVVAAAGVVAGCAGHSGGGHESAGHGGGGSTKTSASMPTAPTAPSAVKPTVKPAATLAGRLLSSTDLKSGFRADSPLSGESGDVATAPAPETPCDAPALGPLLGATGLIGRPTATAGTGILRFDDDFWIGNEVLRTYPGAAEAQQALAGFRALVARCPTRTMAITLHYALTTGPRLGDESVSLSCRMDAASGPKLCDAVVVRVGASIIVVANVGGSPGAERELPALAAAAFQKFQATGP